MYQGTFSLDVSPMISTLEPFDNLAGIVQTLDGHLRHMSGHVVVHRPACQNHLRMMPQLPCLVHQIIRIHGNASSPPTRPGVYLWKFHFVPAASRTSFVFSPILWNMRESSFMRAILISRWMFSITFAASALSSRLWRYPLRLGMHPIFLHHATPSSPVSTISFSSSCKCPSASSPFSVVLYTGISPSSRTTRPRLVRRSRYGTTVRKFRPDL